MVWHFMGHLILLNEQENCICDLLKLTMFQMSIYFSIKKNKFIYNFNITIKIEIIQIKSI